MSTMQRLNNDVYWVFSDRGIEQDIYKTVLGKIIYTICFSQRDMEVQSYLSGS